MKSKNNSVWGIEDKATVDLLKNTKIGGSWLNLCAGDGRFNNYLLEQASEVVAVDIDEKALQKLAKTATNTLRKKLKPKVMDITQPLLFENDSFDWIFCTGALHLFPQSAFVKVVKEAERILKPRGQIIIDFATDIKRTYADGSLWIIENEPNYKLEEALIFLKELFKDYDLYITTDKVNPEKVKLADKEYTFTCNFILLRAVKK